MFLRLEKWPFFGAKQIFGGFFSQASGINSAELTILLPSDLLHQVLVPRGIMSEVAQRRGWTQLDFGLTNGAARSGSRIDVGEEGPAKMLQAPFYHDLFMKKRPLPTMVTR